MPFCGQRRIPPSLPTAWTDGSYTLRRNTHRLEKEIISRPRRDVFATDYIGETVEHFVAGARRCDGHFEPASELAWSRDVLVEYFAIAGASPENRSSAGTLRDGHGSASAGPLNGPQSVHPRPR